MDQKLNKEILEVFMAFTNIKKNVELGSFIKARIRIRSPTSGSGSATPRKSEGRKDRNLESTV
jgi:hypothetical protein